MSTETATTYSTVEVLKACPGLSYRQIDYWCRTGQLGEEHAESLGSGRHRLFTVEDVAVIRAGLVLADFGFNRHARRTALRRIRTAVEGGLHVTHPDQAISFRFDGNAATPGEPRILVPLSALTVDNDDDSR